MHFRIKGLDPHGFKKFYGLSETELACHGVTRYTADSCPGFPDHVELEDSADGDAIEPLIATIFDNLDLQPIHAHNAKQGDFSGLIERA